MPVQVADHVANAGPPDLDGKTASSYAGLTPSLTVDLCWHYALPAWTIQPSISQGSRFPVLAGQLAADSLLLPSINIGGNFRLHRGALQDDPYHSQSQQPKPLPRSSAVAVGTGTLAYPGVWLFAHLGDAVYEPIAARQLVSTRSSDAQATQNTICLMSLQHICALPGPNLA